MARGLRRISRGRGRRPVHGRDWAARYWITRDYPAALPVTSAGGMAAGEWYTAMQWYIFGCAGITRRVVAAGNGFYGFCVKG